MRFSLALILFIIALTPLYLLVLRFVLKAKKVKSDTADAKPKIALVFLATSFIPMLLIVYLQLTSIFVNSWVPLLLYPIAVFFLLIALKFSHKSQRIPLVLTAILLHFIVLQILLPSFGIMLTERSFGLTMLNSAGSWNPEWGLVDPYYNPFPMDLGLFNVVSLTTSINQNDWFNVWILRVFFIVAYDLVFYTLVKRVSGSWRAGVLSVLLLAFTPPAVVNPDPQSLSSLLLLISMLMFFEAFVKKPSLSNIAIANFCFAIAIFIHGTSAIGILLLSVLIAVDFLLFKMVKIPRMGHYKSGFLFTFLGCLTLITLVRWIDVGGMARIASPLESFITDLLGIGGSESTRTTYVPLYDQSVSPLQAYAWAVPASMALAFALYLLIYKKPLRFSKTVLAFTMCVTAFGLQFVGFLGSTFSASVGLQRYLGQSSFVFLIPAAAILGIKILKTSSRVLIGIALMLIVLFSLVGISDPVFSPQLYPGIVTVSVAEYEDYLEGTRFYQILSNETSIISTYEILISVGYLETQGFSGKQIKSYAGSLKTHRNLMERALEQQDFVPEVVYIWTSDVIDPMANAPVNILYNSERHVALEKA